MSKDSRRLLQKMVILAALVVCGVASKSIPVRACVDWELCFENCYDGFYTCANNCHNDPYADPSCIDGCEQQQTDCMSECTWQEPCQ
jgi:hypothetical protein